MDGGGHENESASLAKWSEVREVDGQVEVKEEGEVEGQAKVENEREGEEKG